MKQKFARATLLKSAGRAGTFILSSTSLDRDNDNITRAALKQASLSKSELLCLWQHDPSQPIGVWERLRLDGEKLIADLRLATTSMGQMVAKLIEEAIPLSTSIGFMGSGAPNKVGGVEWTEIELVECSVVSIPSNPEAIQIAKHFGFDPSFVVKSEWAASCPSASQEAIIAAKRAVARTNLLLRTRP